MSDAARFWAKVDKSGPCWLWTAGRTAAGYGVFWVKRRPIYAHRWAYEASIGPIAEGMQVDHVASRGCRNRHCVRPEHLEQVTQRVNISRGRGASARNGRKVACPKGHPYDEANTYVTSKGYRQCRMCRREAA